MHRRVNILQYVKTPSGAWRWEAIPKNPRSKQYLWSKAKSEHFYIVWREEKKRRYEKVGSTPADALEAKRRKELELAGQAFLGKKIPRSYKDGISVDASLEDFLEFVKNKKRPNTHKRYRAVMAHFRRFFKPGTLLENITPADLDFYRDERLNSAEKITPRNVNFEIATIRTFFYYLRKIRGIDIENPAAKLKPLSVPRLIVDSYEEEELHTFFKACNREERTLFKMLYFTGLRDQELAHVAWKDIDFGRNIVRVRAKPQYGFVPKDWEERTIPLNPELISLLKKYPKRHPELVFPSLTGKPNAHLLRILRRVVSRADIAGKWYLHKFRKTFATRALERGADVRTVQELLGHKNITTTARYLSTSTEKMREAVGRL